MEYCYGEGCIVNLSLATASALFKFQILMNHYTMKSQMIKAGCMFFKVVFHHLIHVQNNFYLYAFEGHINVGWAPHPALGSPVRQPCPRVFMYTAIK